MSNQYPQHFGHCAKDLLQFHPTRTSANLYIETVRNNEQRYQYQPHSRSDHNTQWSTLQMTPAFFTEETSSQHNYHGCPWDFSGFVPQIFMFTYGSWVRPCPLLLCPNQNLGSTPAASPGLCSWVCPRCLHLTSTAVYKPGANPSSCVLAHHRLTPTMGLHCFVHSCVKNVMLQKSTQMAKDCTRDYGPGFGPISCDWTAPLCSPASSPLAVPLHTPRPTLINQSSLHIPVGRSCYHRHVPWMPGHPHLLADLQVAQAFTAGHGPYHSVCICKWPLPLNGHL